MNRLELEGIEVALGGRTVLHDVNVTVPTDGGVVALLGPNGAGKTTLLRTTLGLVKPVRGTVQICGKPAHKAWRHVGYVPQRHAFAWDYPLSIEQVVLSGRTKHLGWLRWPGVEDHKAVRQSLKRVGLEDLATRVVGELSGGQRQRVLIARALATKPEILLLDEPFTGVDMPTQEVLATLLEDLAADGTTVVLTTHDLPQALGLAERVILVNRTIMADGTPSEVTEASVWRRAFGISENSPLLKMVAAC